MVMVLIMINLMVIRLVISGGRDHMLTVRRLETIQALYAAEAGMHMSIRETMIPDDEDVDTGIGTISDDTDDATDPAFGAAQVVVTAVTGGGQTTITSTGRSGDSQRKMVAVVD